MTTVREIMTAGAECVGENEALEDAARKTKDLGVGALPICGEDNRVKWRGHRPRHRARVPGHRHRSPTGQGRASGSGHPITIGADESVEEAVKAMTGTQLRRLPVLDGHDLVGMVSQAEIAGTYPEDQVGELVELISFDEH